MNKEFKSIDTQMIKRYLQRVFVAIALLPCLCYASDVNQSDDEREVLTYRISLVGPINLTAQPLHVRFHFCPVEGNNNRNSFEKEVDLQDIKIIPERFQCFLSPALASLDPLRPLPDDFNFGYSYKYLSGNFTFKDHNYEWQGVDNFSIAYPLHGKWEFPLTGINYDRHETLAELLLTVRLENDAIYEVKRFPRIIPHIPGALGPQLAGHHYYDGNMVYFRQSRSQTWTNPRGPNGHADSYTRLYKEHDDDISTHKGLKIIFVQPFLVPGEGHLEDYRGDYDYIGDLEPQYRKNNLDTDAFIYSDGMQTYIPKITQELWKRNGIRVGFAIASYSDAYKAKFNDNVLIEGSLGFPEGLYRRISITKQDGRRFEQWEEIEQKQTIKLDMSEDRSGIKAEIILNNQTPNNFLAYLSHSKVINAIDLDLSYCTNGEREDILCECLQQWTNLESLRVTLLDRNGRVNAGLLTKLWRAVPHSIKEIKLGKAWERYTGENFPLSAFIDHIGRFKELTHLKIKYSQNKRETTRMIATLVQLANLTHIDFEGTPIGGKAATIIARNLEHLNNVTFLSLKNTGYELGGLARLSRVFGRFLDSWMGKKENAWKKNDNDLEENDDLLDDDFAIVLSQNLQHIPKLKHLDLSKNSIGDTGAVHIGQGLRSTPLLSFLDLSDNSIGDEGTRELAKVFPTIKQLYSLRLARCALGSNGVQALGENLHHLRNLRHLDIARNRPLNNNARRIMLNALPTLPSLQYLNLSKLGIGDSLSEALTPVLAALTCLQTLNMSNNALRNEGAVAIGVSLRHMTRLTCLFLGSNSISNQSLSVISQNLQYVSNLIALDLGGNQFYGSDKFGNEWHLTSGPLTLAQNLIFLPALKHLSLGQNNIGDRGGLAIIHNLHHLPQLRSLNLSDNYLADSTLRDLANHLGDVPNLEVLDLKQNCVGMPQIHLSIETAAAFANNIQHTPHLFALYFSYISQQGAELIRQRGGNVYGYPFLN